MVYILLPTVAIVASATVIIASAPLWACAIPQQLGLLTKTFLISFAPSLDLTCMCPSGSRYQLFSRSSVSGATPIFNLRLFVWADNPTKGEAVHSSPKVPEGLSSLFGKASLTSSVRPTIPSPPYTACGPKGAMRAWFAHREPSLLHFCLLAIFSADLFVLPGFRMHLHLFVADVLQASPCSSQAQLTR
eukprot:EG_transcript_24418